MNERIEKEIARYLREECAGDDEPTVEETAKHFYDLGCRHTAVMYDDIEFERQRRQEKEPQGLDEAAEEYAKLRNAAYETVFYAFKAGAEWMAEQGVSKEAEIEVHGDVGWLKQSTSVIDVPDDFKDGDTVIVQVRKKEDK